MARSHRLTCLQTEVNNKAFRGQLFAHFCLGAGFRMGLKLSEGIIRTTYDRFRSKNPKNLDFDFQRKIQNFLRL